MARRAAEILAGMLLITTAVGPQGSFTAEATEPPPLLHADEAARNSQRDNANQHQTSAVPPPSGLEQLARAIILENLPREYVDDKHWGKTTEITTGLKVSLDGLRIKTKRRKKRVNQGTWRRYRIWLIDPQQRFQLRIDNVHDAGGGRVGFDAHIAAPLRASARLAEWQTGIQLLNVSTEATAVVRLSLRCQVGLELDASRLPPDIVLRPEVTEAKLDISDFRVQKVSKLRGSVARELGRSLRGVIERKIREREAKLVTKINRRIAQNEKKLRLSPTDLVGSKWNDLLRLAGDAPEAEGKVSGTVELGEWQMRIYLHKSTKRTSRSADRHSRVPWVPACAGRTEDLLRHSRGGGNPAKLACSRCELVNSFLPLALETATPSAAD